jgi:two-component system chemotaxis sensor kinase CheA
MARDPYKYFRIEARELLEQLGKGLLDLEKGAAAPGLMSQMLRLTHTLKGAARVVKQIEISECAHAIEEVLTPFRDTPAAVPRQGIDEVLRLLDIIGSRVAALALPAEEMPAAPARPVLEEAFRTVRADVGEMDALLEGIAETHAQIKTLKRSFSSVERARVLADLLAQQQSPRHHGEGARATIAGRSYALAEELGTLLTGLEQDLTASTDRVERELRQLRDTAEQLRLLPVSALFTSLERTVRDAAQTLGKKAMFDSRGGEVRLDAHVLGVLQSALLQLVRNGVAHGIETAAERKAAGKPEEGCIALGVARFGRRIVFSCSDDGRGVDLDAVRRAARRKGLPSAEIQKLDAAGLLQLLLRGGISTSSAVTEMAGRGIGLDLAREAAERLGGELNISTEANKGTTIELVVPLSVASLDALLVETSDTVTAIPLDMVRYTLRVAASDVVQNAQGQSIVHQGCLIPFVPLSQVLRPGGTMARYERPWSAVVVQGRESAAAIGVDRLLGTTNIVFRPLPELSPLSTVVAGAWLDAEGNPQLVLEVDGIVDAASQADADDPGAATPRISILVIDDSLTTRMLEKSILESAGFDVSLATSAEEGLEAARAGHYALFLVDVEMPGMDGFTFVEHVRADPKLGNIPAILITSRASAEDLQRGKDVGAQRYIVKREFDQREFLEHVRQLVT